MPFSRPFPPRLTRTVAVLLVLASACFALWCFVRSPGMDAYSRARFGDTMTGRAWRPFVGRVLLPWTVRATTAAMPTSARQALARQVRTRVAGPLGLEYVADYPVEFALTVVFLFGCLLGFAWSLRRLARTTTRLTPAALDFLPVPALLGLPCFYTYMNYVYDFPNLLLFTLGLALIAERRWPAYLAVFGLATVNKETSLLLTLVWFLASRPGLSRRQLLAGTALQVGIWIGLRAPIALIYADNPGSLLEWWHLPDNVALPGRIVRNLRDRPLTDIVARWGLKLALVPAFVALGLSFRRSSVFLRRAAWVVLPLALLTLFLGSFEEARDFYEFYPVAVLILASGVDRLCRPPGSDNPARSPGRAAPASRSRTASRGW